MPTIFQKLDARRKAASKQTSKDTSLIKTFKIVDTNYTSHAVDIPEDFLSPLNDPSTIKVERVDFENSELSEYKGLYAVVLDHVLSQEECEHLIRMAEMSAGAHGERDLANNGWIPAMVSAAFGREFLAPDYRNSDRIVWDNHDLVERVWNRILQGNGMKEDLATLEGDRNLQVGCRTGHQWTAIKQGLNERMRFLKYGAGQFFRRHCDGAFQTPDGSRRSFYTVHLYLNDSAQVLGLDTPKSRKAAMAKELKEERPGDLLFGGATTFHSDVKSDKRIDIDPKAGRVLIFQQRRLLHSGDDVVAGIKYTMRSDLMYEIDGGNDEGDVVFR